MNLCKLCKEPISDFICTGCLGRDILERIPESLRGSLSDFHGTLSYHLHSGKEGFMPCLKCRLSDSPCICIPCYLNEIHSWFRENMLLGRLERNLSLDFEALRRNLKEHSALPVTETESTRERDGICDECGEYSDSLAVANSEWVCPGCRGG